eukprot:6064548-Pleurochrysis_carterae.AAC.2
MHNSEHELTRAPEGRTARGVGREHRCVSAEGQASTLARERRQEGVVVRGNGDGNQGENPAKGENAQRKRATSLRKREEAAQSKQEQRRACKSGREHVKAPARAALERTRGGMETSEKRRRSLARTQKAVRDRARKVAERERERERAIEKGSRAGLSRDERERAERGAGTEGGTEGGRGGSDGGRRNDER